MANAILNFHFDYWHTSLRWQVDDVIVNLDVDVDDDLDLDLGDVEVNGEVKVYVDFAADVGGDVEGRLFKDITLWTRLVG